MNNLDDKPDSDRVSLKKFDNKANINQRSLYIYEQYLKKTATNHTTTLDNPVNNSDKYSDDTVAAPTQPIPNHKSVTTTNVYKVTDSDKADKSTTILIVIGTICALLLAAVVVILFDTTDTLVDRLSAVDTQMSEVSNNISVIGKENSAATAKALADEKAKNAINTKNLALLKDSVNSMALNAELEKAQSEVVMTTRMRSMQIGESNTELDITSNDNSTQPTISYDAFKDESQSVLYRDSSN